MNNNDIVDDDDDDDGGDDYRQKVINSITVQKKDVSRRGFFHAVDNK